jgi:AraC-like DNA-binding protein
MDLDRLNGFFNNLQVILSLPPKSALSEMISAVGHLGLTTGGAEFVVVRDGVARIVLGLDRLPAPTRFGILWRVLRAHNTGKLVAALEDPLRDRGDPVDTRIQATLTYLATSYCHRHRCRLGHLARRVRLSPSYLCRRIRKDTGKTLGEHVRRIRVERASTLITLNPRRHLRHIARAVGFKDDADLCHNFKRLTGCSPRQYLRLRQSTDPRR